MGDSLGLASKVTFESVALKLLGCGEPVALQVFLEEKLRLLDPSEDKMQTTMLCTWLLELYLEQTIYDTECPDTGAGTGGEEAHDLQVDAQMDAGERSGAAPSDASRQRQEREDLDAKLLDFLEEHRSSLDEETTFQVFIYIRWHGDREGCTRMRARLYVFVSGGKRNTP